MHYCEECGSYTRNLAYSKDVPYLLCTDCAADIEDAIEDAWSKSL